MLTEKSDVIAFLYEFSPKGLVFRIFLLFLPNYIQLFYCFTKKSNYEENFNRYVCLRIVPGHEFLYKRE